MESQLEVLEDIRSEIREINLSMKLVLYGFGIMGLLVLVVSFFKK